MSRQAHTKQTERPITNAILIVTLPLALSLLLVNMLPRMCDFVVYLFIALKDSFNISSPSFWSLHYRHCYGARIGICLLFFFFIPSLTLTLNVGLIL
uniref:Uncharacterized protein n=1 Tax=Glossina palpalis gambiensis TaxID=67801 RepID=A0A1B0AME2_9MUSC